MINELLEIGGMAAGAAALEQTYVFTMSRAPWQSLSAGKGIATGGVLNLFGYGPGKAIGAGLGMLGVGETGWGSNLRKFFAGGNMFEESLGYDPEILKKKFHPRPQARAAAEIQQFHSNKIKAKHLKFAGRLAGGLAIANLVGSLVSPMVYYAGRGISAVSDAARQPMAALNSPDWGNQLGSAYMTAQASTERQRATQMLQQTGITGHGSIGREANRMHR